MKLPFSIVSQIHYSHDRILSLLLKKHPQIPVNAAQMRLLMSLWEKDEINMQEMAERNCLKKTTLSTMLPRMIESGLIHLNTASNDHRSRIISLTDEARSLKSVHEELNEALEKELCAGITEEEKQIFFKVLLRLRENLQKKEKELSNETIKP